MGFFDAMGMPPPPPRFDGSAGGAAEVSKSMPPPPPTFDGAPAMSAAPSDPEPQHVEEEAAPPPQAAAPPPGGYEQPEWGGVPSVDFSLEVLKDGAIIETIDCAGRDHLRFGRTPNNDVVLEHPSSSRLHAVLQFANGSEEIFVHDCGSTHGTTVNKRRLKPGVHAPVFVGDQIKFGQSSRAFIVAGAVELMPEEGLSREERRKLRALEKMSEQEAVVEIEREQRARAQAAAATAAGASWGLEDDDTLEEQQREADLLEHFDWREHQGTFTEKQQDQREKIQRREQKIANMKAEIERIKAKETSDNPLTAGQQNQITRNETAAEKLEEEIEDMDEVLNDSLRESLGAKRINREGGKRRKKKKKKGAYSDSDYSDDDDDDFYDRTDAAKERRRKKEKAKADKRAAERGETTTNGSLPGGAKQPETVETAATLWEKRQVAEAAIKELEGRAEAAKRRESEKDAAGGVPANAAADDDLDAFMDQIGAKRDAEEVRRLKVQIGERKSELERLERLLRIADPHGEYKPGSALAKSVAKLAEAVRAKVAAAEEAARRRSAAKAEAARTAAQEAKERERLRAWEEQGNLSAKRKFTGGPGPDAGPDAGPVAPSGLGAEAAANAKLPLGISTADDRKKGGGKPAGGVKPSVPEEEMKPMIVDEAGDEVDPRTGEKLVKQIEELEPLPQPVAEAPAPPPEAAPERLEGTMEEEEDDEDDGFMTAEQLKAAASKGGGLDAVIKKRKSVLEIRKPPPGKGPAREPERKRAKTEGGLDGVKTQEELVAEAEAKVQADLQRLLGGGRFGSEAVDEREEDEDDVTDLTGGPGWSAPQGQTGDGRTSLNAKFGY